MSTEREPMGGTAPEGDFPRRQKGSAPMVIVAGHVTVEPRQRES
jgi:hypothetical protein